MRQKRQISWFSPSFHAPQRKALSLTILICLPISKWHATFAFPVRHCQLIFQLEDEDLSLFHLPPFRMNHCPESILRIKEEAQLSIEARLPGCTGVSIAFMPACHPGLQGQRAYSHRGKDRTQPLHLTDTLPHRGPPSLGPASLVLVSPATAALSIGLLGKDSIQFFFF